MWKIIRVTQVAVVALLLTVSCTKDPTDGGGLYNKEYVDFTMELQPPGGYTPAETRAMKNDAQNAINRATVLVYNSADQTLFYHEEGTVTDNKLTVKLKTSQKESDVFDIVVIGNPPEDFDPTAGQKKVEIQAALTSNVTGKWTGTEFMMWGERKSTLINPVNNFKIEMLRSLARIDIGTGVYNHAKETWTGLADFVLTEVLVVNTRDKFAVIPLPENVHTDDKVKVTAFTIPDGTTVQGKTADDALKYSGDDIQNGTIKKHGAYINSTIFVAEAPTTPDNEGVTLIIGGTYKGTESYYRVDFRTSKAVDDDYLPLLRNHRYRIIITEILAAGATTAEQALASPPMDNIIMTTLEPISESETGGDIVFDGENYIKTDVSEVQIYDAPNGVNEYDIFTVKIGSEAGLSTIGTVTGPGISGSLTLVNGVSQLVKVPIPAGTGTYPYIVEFGTLQKTINVIVQAPLQGFSTVLPFTEVVSITTDGSDWLTLSQSVNVQGQQNLDFIEGDPQGKAYMHLTENTSIRGATRTARAIVTHNDSRGITRVMLKQRKNEIAGYFGGNPINTMEGIGTMYPKQLIVASNDIVNRYKTSKTGNASIANSIYYGRDMNIAAAKLGNSELANYPAFEYCARLNKDLNGDGIINDLEMVWYLPSLRQLMAMYVFNCGMDIPFSATVYWSATELESSLACYVSFDDGTTNSSSIWVPNSNPKTNRYAIRCVRDAMP